MPKTKTIPRKTATTRETSATLAARVAAAVIPQRFGDVCEVSDATQALVMDLARALEQEYPLAELDNVIALEQEIARALPEALQGRFHQLLEAKTEQTCLGQELGYHVGLAIGRTLAGGAR